MYKLYKEVMTNAVAGVYKFNENGSVTAIPFDPANTDYQEYLKWVAEGNEPLPAENE
jgi:hypothetical protein